MQEKQASFDEEETASCRVFASLYLKQEVSYTVGELQFSSEH